jgi:hypothetical protein
MTDDEDWVRQCRQCHGVHTGADAVQYVWEFALCSCGVPIVVGVNVDDDDDGYVYCAFTYWHDEPKQPYPLGDTGEFIVSCRHGAGTVPTEGDIARWVAWESSPLPPRDWLIVDDRRFRSVAATVDALRRRADMPDEVSIAGDWDGTGLDSAYRAGARSWARCSRAGTADCGRGRLGLSQSGLLRSADPEDGRRHESLDDEVDAERQLPDELRDRPDELNCVVVMRWPPLLHGSALRRRRPTASQYPVVSLGFFPTLKCLTPSVW